MPSTGVVTLLPSCLAPSLGWWDGPWMVKTYPATSEDTPHIFLASSHQRGPKWHFLSSQRWDYARSEVRAILLHLPVPATTGVTWSAVLHWQMLCGEEVAMAGVRDVRSICTFTCCVSWQERKKNTLPECIFLLSFSSTGLASEHPSQVRTSFRFGTGLVPLRREFKNISICKHKLKANY